MLLAFLDSGEGILPGFLAYIFVSLIGALLLRFSWRSLTGSGRPNCLLIALLLAIMLRLAVGVCLTHGLPHYGYGDSVPHQAGYIFKDAYQRDSQAWQLAGSDRPLIQAWGGDYSSDQYGGLLFISAFLYRTLSPDVHRPIIVILLASTVGSLCVLFAWSFAQRLFGDRAAMFAAWVVALYPEAVLLGSSQMREPFLMTAFALGLDGYARSRSTNLRQGLPRWLYGLILALLISPPYALIILILLILAWLWEKRGAARQTPIMIGALLLFCIVAMALTLRAWATIEGGPQGNLLELVDWWIRSGARYQLYLLEQSSGWVQTIFGQVPDWMHMPLATLYGLVQPFLPAAVMDNSGAPLIRAIVAFRAFGWFLLLPFLIYAPLAAVRHKGWRSLETYLALVVWAAALLVSYRDAGRLWDNPRWRAVFLCLQAAMAGWAWITARKERDPWLLRIGIVIGIATLTFLHWEMGRYYHTPRLSFWKTLSLTGGLMSLYLVSVLAFDWLLAKRRKA